MHNGGERKMKRLLGIFFVLVAGFLTSCSQRSSLPKSENNTERTSDARYSQEFKNAEFQRDRGRFATDSRERIEFAVSSYELKGAFDWQKRELNATVAMKLRLQCSCQESFVIDSQVEEIKEVKLKETGQSLGFNINGRELGIDLSQVAEEVRKKEFTVLISYRAKAGLNKAGEPTSLTAVDQVAGDPIKSRMLFTFAEPLDASFWMPCLNDPEYRALFSVELKMPASEMLISNGDLIRNEVQGDTRWVKYQTSYSLPTYLMAFAQGEITVATQYHGKLPVSVVARKGVRADFDGMLKETIRQIKHYESLLIPYPFEKYMIVLAPEFPSGGIEHAGITFNDETSSSQSALNRDAGLMAHELGHQWFGDAVTVRTWDDLWIKEGMATLLAEEAMRPYEDGNRTGRLMGHEHSVSEGDAIVDTHLHPDDKYTSGPYGRAAWLLTQIRSAIGEEAFWGALRKVLTDYKFGSIGTAEFLEYFRPAGGNALIAKAEKALLAKSMPSLKVESAEGVAKVTLEDKEGALLLPMEMAWYSDSGALEQFVLTSGSSVSHLVKDVRLMILDPQDRHPVENFGGWNQWSPIATPLMAPRTPEQLKKFLTLGGHLQQRAMISQAGWKLDAKDLPVIFKGLSSELAKYEFFKVACGMAKKETTEVAVWKNEISRAFVRPPYFGIPINGVMPLLGSCQGFVPMDYLKGLWTQIEMAPDAPERSELEFYFASLIPVPTAAGAFNVWTQVTTLGPTVRSRVVGVQNLLRHVTGAGESAKPSETELVAWKKHFKELLETNQTGRLLNVLLPTLGKMKSPEFLPGFAKVLRSETYKSWKPAYCAAQTTVQESAEAKKAFEAAVGDISTLPDSVQSWFSDPKACE